MLDMRLDEATQAGEVERQQIIQELASRPDETLDALIHAVTQLPKSRWSTGVRAIRAIGYPRNAKATEALVSHALNGNSPAHEHAVHALAEIEPRVVIRHLIRALLGFTQDNEFWAEDVDSICLILPDLGRQYAAPCGPALAYVLGVSHAAEEPNKTYLVNVLRLIGPSCAIYSLPALLDVVRMHGETQAGKLARDLIQTFDSNTLGTYTSLLGILGIWKNE